MSDQAFYTDSYTSEFSARIIEKETGPNGNIVVLDHTFFYPTSGGQPFDTGTINGIPVVDVVVREGDGAIVHVMEAFPETAEVTAVVNWERRFDHMQQHTGQHILSQAFIQTADAPTIGFHLSDETVTIDLDLDKIEQAVIDKAEDLANEIVWQNRPVVVRWASQDEAEALPLRKIPQNGGEKLRLIDILDFDLTACGGTHVARTGEVGLIKVIKTESRNKKVRIHFCCGGRALAHCRLINQVIHQLSGQLTTGTADLTASVSKLQDNDKESRRTLKRLQNQLSSLEAQQLLGQAEKVDGWTVVVHVLEDEPGRVRALASRLAEEGRVVALLASTGERTHLVFGRSDDAPGDMKDLLQGAFLHLEGGSGGGSNKFAQGTSPAADFETVEHAVHNAARQLLEQITSLG